MAKKPAALTAGLVARKGEAAPASTEPRRSASKILDTGERIAVTVKLDLERYRRLKLHALEQRSTNQDVMVEALDKFLADS